MEFISGIIAIIIALILLASIFILPLMVIVFKALIVLATIAILLLPIFGVILMIKKLLTN